MSTSGPLVATLVGAGGGLSAGLAFGWWYFRRGATDGTALDDDDGDAAASVSAEQEGVQQQLADLQRSHSRCLDQLAERDQLVAVLRQQAAGLASRLADDAAASLPGERWS